MDEKLDTKEKKADAPPEPAPPVAPRSDVIVRGGATRCPHCHANVDSDQDAWAACQKCLARHHLACWGEGGACGACSEKRFVTSVPARGKATGRGMNPIVVLGIVSVAGILGMQA